MIQEGMPVRALIEPHYTTYFIIIGYTLPVLKNCRECDKQYRTYLPGKDCLLPNGDVECHQEPQLLCPDYDCGYGLHMNQDLLSHLLELYPCHALSE